MLNELLAADPFAGLSAAVIAVIVVIYFLGFFLRGAFGFGSNLPIVLITTWIVGPHHAILLVLMLSVVAQIHLLPQGLKSADWPVTRPLLAGIFVGGGLGTWLFTELSGDWLTLTMGVLIAFVLLIDRLKLLERLRSVIDIRRRAVSLSLATISSAVGSVSGGGGMYFLVVYLRLACATPELLRGTNLVLAALLMFSRIIFVVLAGLISPTLIAETTLLVPVMFLGTWTGTRYFRAVSAQRFYGGVQLLLLAAAIAIMVRGIARLA